jgi:hypothetical protein
MLSIDTGLFNKSVMPVLRPAATPHGGLFYFPSAELRFLK